MKINWKVRIKNPVFWIGLLALFFATLGVDVSTLTSWGALQGCLKSLVTNPFAIGSVIIAIIGYLTDHTTAGIKDSNSVLAYNKPKSVQDDLAAVYADDRRDFDEK